MIDTTADSFRKSTPGPAFYAILAAVFALSILATAYFLQSMSGSMRMPGGWQMSMTWMRMPGQSLTGAFTMFLLMWLAMMMAMMLPSNMPMLVKLNRAHASTILVVCGYYLVWTVIGAVVYIAGFSIADLAMQSATLSNKIPVLTGSLLILASAFQFSRLKMIALVRCRNPFLCVDNPTRSSTSSFLHGLREGLYCALCCSGLMLSFLALGIMNAWFMIAIAALIALEKILPRPRWIVYASGAAGITAGLAIVILTVL